MDSSRQIIENVVNVGKGFSRSFSLTIPSSWGTPTGTPTLTVYEINSGNTDVSSTVTTGSNSVASQVITTKTFTRSGMTAYYTYKAVLEFALSGGGTDSCYFYLYCEE
jgi:hypothetical protein